MARKKEIEVEVRDGEEATRDFDFDFPLAWLLHIAGDVCAKDCSGYRTE